LILNFEQDIYKIARIRLSNQDDINEAVQSTIVKMYYSINKLENNKYFKTWLIKILINECNNIYRQNKRNDEYCENTFKETEYSDIDSKIDDIDFFYLLKNLKYDEKMVISLFYIEDFSVKEISKLLKKPENTIKTWLSRARNKLKKLMEEEDYFSTSNRKGMKIYMNEFDEELKKFLKKDIKLPNEYKTEVRATLKACNDSKIVNFSKEKSKKRKMQKTFQKIAAVIIFGVLGVTSYAGVTGKLNINIGNTGHKKIDESYTDVATFVDKNIDNEYFTLSLESMAADPAYLIFEYDLKFKDTAMEQIGEVPYDEFDGYKISIESETYINNKDISVQYGKNLKNIEKVSDKEFKIVELYNIANINLSEFKLKKMLNSLKIIDTSYNIKLNVDIAEELTADVKFENKDSKVLAETKLSNGSTLYIEAVSNSKFENYVLARIMTEPKMKSEIWNKTNEFMIEDPQFAICNQDDEVINYESYTLEEYYEQVLDDGSIVEYDDANGEDTDIIRIQQVQLLRLGFDDDNIPQSLKILPINRKLYSDKNNSEYNFYMNEDWYEVKTGEVNISETSQIGGKITITKIEETDDKIIFYYDKEGYVPYTIDFALRVKNKKLNYLYPRTEILKGIDGEENEIIYTKDISRLSGCRLIGYDGIDNLDDLEFALFYNIKYDVLSDSLEFEWNENENDNVAKIENIEFSEYVIDINDELEEALSKASGGGFLYQGTITEVNEKAIKFYSDSDKKEFTLSNPETFEYSNGRTNEDLDFSKIKVGDYFSTINYAILKYSVSDNKSSIYNKLTIIRACSGDELEHELLVQMESQGIGWNADFVYRELKDIEIIDDNKAIITFEFSDFYQKYLENDESFTKKFIINDATEIYRDWSGIDSETYSISDLNTVKYVPSRVNIMIDENTVDDEMPVVVKLKLGYLDE
jgi:RNA polymerase sigma-70 factor (ECF subfamily)